MVDIVSKTIDYFYKQKNYNAFKECCKNPLNLFLELQQYIDRNGLNSSGGPDNKYYPARDWHIHFNDYKKGEFEISYTTVLNISKLAPLYYVQHEFSVKDKDDDRMTPVLDGFSNHPYTKKQFVLHDKISSVLNKKGYHELEYVDISEAVEGFKMPEGVTIFGPNVTVEDLLFADLFDVRNK